MDDKRFDELIRGKAEAHIDPSTPSGAEMSRLFEHLPAQVATSWFASTTNKVMTLATTTLFILTIFLIYRTFRLEETIHLMDDSIQKASFSEGKIIYQYDTSMMDSLVSLNGQLDRKLDSLNSIGIRSSMLIQPQQPTIDTEAMANEVMAQLVKEIESNPELMEQIMRQLSGNDQVRENREENSDDSTEKPSLTKESLASRLVAEDQADALLKELNKDPERSKVISNLLSGNDPADSDALNMGVTEQGIESLSEEKKKDLLADYLAYDPESVQESAERAAIDSASVDLIKEYVAVTPLESRGIEKNDSLAITRNPLLFEDIREEQFKENRSILLGLGLGAGRLPLEGYESAGTTSLKLTGEYQPNERYGFASGIEFYRSEAETYDLNSIDITQFENFQAPNDIKEIKVNLQWMDIPLEAKLYLKRGKFSPYAIVSVRARVLLKETYTFETNSDDELTPEFESENNFIVPSFGYGIGSQFYLNPKFNGAIQLHHSIGGKGIGLSNQNLNTIQLQGILYFDLK